MSRILIQLVILFSVISPYSLAETDNDKQAAQVVNNLEEPLYSPFVERYVLDELKQLRIDQAQTKNALLQQIVDREHSSVDRGVSYVTDAITYFFYLIAAATSVLVLVGWSSIRDIKERVHTSADEEITKLISLYEKRLEAIEDQLKQKTLHIEENREEIELTQEIQSLWLRAAQDASPANKISVYDEILKLRDNDCEALTYKADAVLEMNEPQWAANLCNQALKIDPENGHAFYQLACAYTAMNRFDEAVVSLKEAIDKQESFREDIVADTALEKLKGYQPFDQLLGVSHHRGGEGD
jgi:tetratricopeptide (TPR) repeat protein